MRTLLILLTALLISSCGNLTEQDRQFLRKVGAAAGGMQPQVGMPNRSGTEFLKNEYTQGFNKVCVYDRLGSVDTLVVSATSLCPLTL